MVLLLFLSLSQKYGNHFTWTKKATLCPLYKLYFLLTTQLVSSEYYVNTNYLFVKFYSFNFLHNCICLIRLLSMLINWFNVAVSYFSFQVIERVRLRDLWTAKLFGSFYLISKFKFSVPSIFHSLLTCYDSLSYFSFAGFSRWRQEENKNKIARSYIQHKRKEWNFGGVKGRGDGHTTINFFSHP